MKNVHKKVKYLIVGIIFFTIVIAVILICLPKQQEITVMVISDSLQIMQNEDTEKTFIKWVEFKPSADVLTYAYELDLEAHKNGQYVTWIELLAYAGAKHGGAFPNNVKKEMNALAKKIRNKETTIEEATKDMKYYNYYLEAYTAVLGGFVGTYEKQEMDEAGNVTWVSTYGLKAFSPIAKGFAYNDYDDFGTARSYGYSRPHLGHDMMGLVGTPIIAIESGYVEALGWNQYGGWRIGIRSFDKKRYYYYAHLRQNRPYAEGLEEGSIVTAGDVIGYMGHTGYSTKENVNNIKVTHLHWGLQLIFDESQKEGNNEIWVNCYELSNFLYKNRSNVIRNDETKEWTREFQIKEEQTKIIDQPTKTDCKNENLMIK